LFLLQYVAADYPAAVHRGEVIDNFEYREMLSFSRLLVERFNVFRTAGADEENLVALRQLERGIRDRVSRAEVRDLSGGLIRRLLDELDTVALPVKAPDLERGRQLYAEDCAACHGPSGGGDGPSAPGMVPPATSFRDARLNVLSPHHVFGAIDFGVEGTAMPSYGWALPAEDMWDMAFFVMTMRDGFEPRRPYPPLLLSAGDLAAASNEELLALVGRARPDVQVSHIDYYRLNVPPATPAADLLAPVATETPKNSAADSPDLQLALGLQDAFAAVAERLFPSVVGVSGFVRRPADTGEGSGAENPGAWREGSTEDRMYPGFERVGSGSGFIVSKEGHILTTHQVLVGPDGGIVDAVDVEMHDGRHVLARVVGVEPTINLGVLQLEVYSRVQPFPIQPIETGGGYSQRVGHWTIALGDPVGPGTTYAVGTLATLPERQCYQGDLSATLMQTSLRVPDQAYGGPLVNIRGEVVGMTVPRPHADPRVARAAEFALPIDLALGIYEALKVKESVNSPWLGFSILELATVRRTGQVDWSSLSRTGVFIDDVFEPSAASAADIRIGDCLVSLDGHRLLSVLDFQKWLYLSGIGRTVTLEIFRNGETLEKSVTIERRPESVRPR